MIKRFRRDEQPQRIYAIGDLHGRADLFRRMIEIIRRDNARRAAVSTKIVVLGDIIDRGPDSATLVRWCRELTANTDRFVVLKGNHEAMMIGALRHGDLDMLALWMEQGGGEALASWGLPKEVIARGPGLELLSAARGVIEAASMEWMANLPLWVSHEDFLFVHAGIRPGLKLKAQKEVDLLTIRGEFLSSKLDHGPIVVHGHSIHEAGPDIQRNRIGIDTGAFRTGRLTALGVERGEFWPLMTEAARPANQAGAAM